MRFDARTIKPHAEPVRLADLITGSVYFTVQFVDHELLVPEVRPVVFIGKDLMPEDMGKLYFQDAESYHQGVRFGSPEDDEAVFFSQNDEETKHIFVFEKALEALMACSLRRQGIRSSRE